MTAWTEIGPMAAARRFVEGFNSDDMVLAQTACADEMTIIDDFPPFEWSGRGAVGAWSGDMARMAAEFRMSARSVTLDEPRMEVVADGRAYLVVPIDVHWSEDGAPAERRGCMTLALRDFVGWWRITTLAWTWA